MLHYPKIPGSSQAPTGRCVAFEKYDGTNLHWQWDRDFGWHAFGTRRDQYNLNESGIAAFEERHAHLKESVAVFRATLADQLEGIFATHPRYSRASGCKAFTEFLGPGSFAGLHRAEDAKELRLIDISVEPTGLIGPHQFVEDFGRLLQAARVVYTGPYTGKFADAVRRGDYNVTEGVVCKGGLGGEDLWMVKIKTQAYLEKLKKAFADKWEDYWE